MKVTTITFNMLTGADITFVNVDVDYKGAFIIVTQASGNMTAVSTANLRRADWTPAPAPSPLPAPPPITGGE